MDNIKLDGSSKNKILITSCIFMGLSHILYFKQYLKGALFAFVEILFLINLPSITNKIYNLITLGTPQPEVGIKFRDNSVFMLIDGVIILAVIAVFIAIYVISVKSATSNYKTCCIMGDIKYGKNGLSDLSDKSFSILGLAPAVSLVLFFVIVPLVFSALVAFTNYSSPEHIPPNNTVDWVGFDNFIFLFSGESSWTSALGRVATWTLVWAASATLTCYFGGLLMAVIMTESKIKLAPIYRLIFILPYAVPSVVSMLVWQNLLNGTFGTVNRTLMELGLISSAIPWLSDPVVAKFTVILVNLWAGFPYFMLLTMGTMTAISADVFEAARIDGANKFQIFKGITLPLVLYQTMPLIIMSFTFNINNFGSIFFLTGGAPVVADTTVTGAGGTDILVTWIYNLTVVLMKYNYASVLAVMIFVVLAPFAIMNFRRTKSFKEGEL